MDIRSVLLFLSQKTKTIHSFVLSFAANIFCGGASSCVSHSATLHFVKGERVQAHGSRGLSIRRHCLSGGRNTHRCPTPGGRGRAAEGRTIAGALHSAMPAIGEGQRLWI